MKFNGFVFNGTPSWNFPWLYVNKATGSILPAVERNYLTVPGRPGGYHARRTVGMRQEKIKITVTADSLEELQERRRILADWLDTEKEAEFYYEYEKDKKYYAALSGETDLDKVVTDGECELVFLMGDPYAETKSQSAQLMGKSIRFGGVDAESFQNDGTHHHTEVVGDHIELRKTGKDTGFTVDTDWNLGTFTEIVEDSDEQGEHIRLNRSKAGTDVIKKWNTDADFNAGNHNGTIVSGSELQLPVENYTFIDDMADLDDWDISGIEGVNVIDGTGVIIIDNRATSTDDGTMSAVRRSGVVEYPFTLDWFAKNEHVDGKSGPDPYLYITDGTTSGIDLTLPVTGNTASWFRAIVNAAGDTLSLYQDGAHVGDYPMNGGIFSNRVTLGVDPGARVRTTLEAVYYNSGTDLGTPPPNHEIAGTWTSEEIDLESVTEAGEPREITFTYAADTDVNSITAMGYTLEQRVYDGAAWGAWETVYDVDTTLDETKTFGVPGINTGDNMTGKRIQYRITLTSRDIAYSPRVSLLGIEITSRNTYSTSGSWVGPTYTNVKNVGVVGDSVVSWEENVPENTTLTVYARFRRNPDATFSPWYECTNGEPVPNMQGQDMSEGDLEYKVEMSTNASDETPRLYQIDFDFFTALYNSGHWTTDLVDLSTLENIGTTAVEWQRITDTPFTYEHLTRVMPSEVIDITDMDGDDNGDGVVDGWEKSADDPDVTESITFDDVEKAQKIAVTASNDSAYVHVKRQVSITEGEVYSLSADYKSSDITGTFRGRALIAWKDSTDSVISHSFGPDITANTDTWTRTKLENVTAPLGAVAAEIRLEANPGAAGDVGTLWFRSSLLNTGSTALSYPVWQTIENSGDPIPGLISPDQKVQGRVTMATTDPMQTPKVSLFELLIEEERVNHIEYGGTAPGFPKLTFTINEGGIEQLQVTHVESGQFILIGDTFKAGDVIEVDHNAASIRVNGVYRMKALNMKSRFFRLRKGTNTFTVKPQGGAEMVIEWKERWK